MKKTNFTKFKTLTAVAVVFLFAIWGCQNEAIISVNNDRLTEQEWKQIKDSEPFMIGYNTILGVNLIIESTNLTYKELLEYVYNEESRHKYEQKITNSNILKENIVADVLAFDTSFNKLLELNPKLRKSKQLQNKLKEYLYVYATYIEDNVDDIKSSYEKEQMKKLNNIANRLLPCGHKDLGRIRRPNDVRKCHRMGGYLFRGFVGYICAKEDLISSPPCFSRRKYIKLNEIIVKGYLKKPKSTTINMNKFLFYNPHRYNPIKNHLYIPPKKPPYIYGGYGGGVPIKLPDNRYDSTNRIFESLSDETKCVYDKLKNYFIIEYAIKEFKGDTPKDLVIMEKPFGEEAHGQTTFEGGKTIKIELNTRDMRNKPAEFVALTIIHELIHADILRKLATANLLAKDSNDRYTKIKNGAKLSFPVIFNYYNKYPTQPHHSNMAENYINAMAKGLKVYSTLTGKTHPDKFYEDMAWTGLHKTDVWKKKSPAEQKRILAVIDKFKNSGKNDCK